MPLVLFNASTVFALENDDYVPEVTAKVARISFMRGEVQIRRADSQDWEKAVQNLPLVEGDQIATGENSRIEIQFDTKKFLRLDENSFLKIVTLRDEGKAVSLPQGTMSLRLLEFDKDIQYFEIDAPNTTISVQKYGLYRVDSGDSQNSVVRVAVTDDGQARVYSDNSGFTLRNGRSAKIYLDGNNQGEWETSEASRYADEFDSWVLDRDAKTAKRLQQAHYDKYYDRDMYGAEELNENGEWIYTKKYGYVWRPYKTATNIYRDWSPYRYGHWRYVAPFGWTWINDEPWGWATYHHGRWIYDNGEWCWTPYTYYRMRRSWWLPSSVHIIYVGNNICWYPSSYYDRYYDYNRGHRRRGRGNNTTIINNNITIINPTPTPTPNVVSGDVPVRGIDGMIRVRDIPPNSIISLPSDQFGKIRGDIKPVDVATAKKILSDDKAIVRGLPKLDNQIGTDVRVERGVLAKRPSVRNEPIEEVKTGAIDRKIGSKSDETLQEQVVRGGRQPIDRSTERQKDLSGGGSKVETRETGAMQRPNMRKNEETKQDETNRRQPMPKNDFPNTSTGNGSGNSNDRKPVYVPREKSEDNNNDRKPVNPPRNEENKRPPLYNPPSNEDRKPRNEPRNETPRYEPPREKPRSDPPPRNDPPKRSDPPPSNDRKPSSPPPSDRKSDTEVKDN
ncbi:MAG: FecR domain-containing protein [Pyrinomonadaceae bacterium]|nr:FecR domain-containing protein [Pyrinomonadaceae bacterium]